MSFFVLIALAESCHKGIGLVTAVKMAQVSELKTGEAGNSLFSFLCNYSCNRGGESSEVVPEYHRWYAEYVWEDNSFNTEVAEQEDFIVIAFFHSEDIPFVTVAVFKQKLKLLFW